MVVLVLHLAMRDVPQGSTAVTIPGATSSQQEQEDDNTMEDMQIEDTMPDSNPC